MNTAANREKFKKAVRRITIGGGTNLVSGLTLGYKEVSSNYNGKYVNRVLFLTDGMGTSTGILDMAQRQRNRGINVSTIGVGTGFDLRLMRDLAENGGAAPGLSLTGRRWKKPLAASSTEWSFLLPMTCT